MLILKYRDEIHVLITGRPSHEKERMKAEPFEVRYAQLDFARVLGIPLSKSLQLLQVLIPSHVLTDID